MTVNVDPLCPQQHTHPKHDPNRCIFCDYGAAVRADAFDAAEAAVERAHDWYELSEGLEGRAMMKCDALAAIRALKEKP